MQDEKVSVIVVKVKDFLNQIVVQDFQIKSKTPIYIRIGRKSIIKIAMNTFSFGSLARYLYFFFSGLGFCAWSKNICIEA